MIVNLYEIEWEFLLKEISIHSQKFPVDFLRLNRMGIWGLNEWLIFGILSKKSTISKSRNIILLKIPTQGFSV